VYEPFFNYEIIPDTLAFSVTSSSKALAFKPGMTHDEAGTIIRSINLLTKKAANAYTIDNTITVEHARDGKVSKIAII
jgi:hypothetical protein